MPPTVPAGPAQGRLEQTVRFHRDPLGTLRRAQADHGDVFTLRMTTTGPLVAIATAAGVAEVPAADPRPGHAGEARRQVLGLVSPRSILGADGEVHRSARDRVAHVFTPEAVDRHRDRMAAIAAEHAASWPTDRPFRLLPRIRLLCDDLFCRLLVGAPDPELPHAVRKMINTPGNPPLTPTVDGAGLMGALVKRVFEHRKGPAAEHLTAAIDARRGGPATTDDVIGAVLEAEPGADTATLVDELLSLLMAGQEPPAAGLTWLLDRMAREHHPQTAPDAAFVDETFRLRPPVHSVVRRLVEPARIAGVDLPAHALPMVPIPLVHRDPAAFPDPDAFRPGRPGAEHLLPFGGGPRRCLGEPLTHAMIATVVPAIRAKIGRAHV